MRECKLCDREATTAPEFHDYTRYDQNGNYSEWLSKYDILWIPEFELTCKDCLRLIIRAIYLTRTAGYGGTSRMTEQDFYNRDLYNKIATTEEFTIALCKLIDSKAKRISDNTSVDRCLAVSKSGRQCMNYATQIRDETRVCKFHAHPDKTVIGTVAKPRDKIAERLTAELMETI